MLITHGDTIMPGPTTLPDEIRNRLKNTPEQQNVVGPLVLYLTSIGWNLEQIIFGRHEWYVPKSPSESTKREKGRSYSGFPVDITVFDDPLYTRDPMHLLFMIECKQPTESAGMTQLEDYFGLEPHSKLGIWANNPDLSAPSTFLYREPNGIILIKRRLVADIPRPHEPIEPEVRRITFNDLISPSGEVFRRTIEDLLDKVVISDTNVTRREDQLDQLCNMLLLKLESDKEGKVNRASPISFQPMESTATTACAIRERFTSFVNLYPETFITEQDRTLRFNDETLASCVDTLSGLRLIDLGVSMVSMAFQVLRSEALKQGEGQYFTPQAVIEAGVHLMQIQWGDLILDPACGTGGFLVESLKQIMQSNPEMTEEDLSRWAQTHIFGIEKDAIGLKLTKAIMQIARDGSAHCVRGDSIRTQNWSRDFPHLRGGNFENGRFSVIVTNPPFGKNLKVSAKDARLAELDIAKAGGDTYQDMEIGLLFLQRAYQWLRDGGRVGIVLPETYFFSSNYSFLLDWIRPKLKPVVVANIPMEAFQGFCRAKTNFYVFEKIS
jgi:type I restriction enzyme M protein